MGRYLYTGISNKYFLYNDKTFNIIVFIVYICVDTKTHIVH